jgi:hypothetical protein
LQLEHVHFVHDLKKTYPVDASPGQELQWLPTTADPGYLCMWLACMQNLT